MSDRTLSDLINEAWLTGKEASFEYNGTTYSFSPTGLAQFISDTAPTSTPYTDADAENAIATKTEVAALVSPTADYADLTEATAAIKSIIDALKA